MSHSKVSIFRHLFDFILLILIIVFGLYGIISLKFDVAAQIAVTVIMSVLYVFWGIFHHYHDGNLTIKVALEYIGMAFLVGTMLVIFLLRI